MTVKTPVELHGGSVHRSSDGLGKGCEFTIRLPLLDGAPASDAGGDAPGEQPATGRRVLVIEDNVDAASSLREALEFEGHEIAVAHDGPAGLELARRFAPEVLLCDIGLPGMDGYDVARAFRADPALRGARLVAVTGYALPEDKRRAAEAGFDAHLAKPPDLDVLLQVVSEPARQDADRSTTAGS